MKKLLFFGSIILLLAIAVYYRFSSTGYFREIAPFFEGEIMTTFKLPGAEDITVAYQDSFAIVSSMDRRADSLAEEVSAGIYFIDLKKSEYIPRKISEHLEIGLHPHGISLFRLDSMHYQLLVVNHYKGHTIEKFELFGDSLVHIETHGSDLLISPNDVIAQDENRFYVTNDHGYSELWKRKLEDYLGLRSSNVLFFQDQQFEVVAGKIAYANGINFNPKRNLLYVASVTEFMIKVYDVEQETGALTFIENIDCHTGVDNIELDPEGIIYSGGHPNLLGFVAYSKGKKAFAPSEVIKVIYSDIGRYRVESIFRDDGEIISGTSVAAPFGNVILVGSVMDENVLVLSRDH